MRLNPRNLQRMLPAAWLGALLGGCIVSPTHDAPIVERSQVGPAVAPADVRPAPAAATPAAREAHDGLYVVQPGDTLYSVALAFGQDYRDVARWNGLDDPTHLRVGQPLRVAADAGNGDAGSATAEAVPVPITPSGSVQTRPLEPAAGGGGPSPTAIADRGADAPAPAAAATAAAGIAPSLLPPEKPVALEPGGPWAWPSAGKVLERFDESRNKGIEIGGSIGDAVLAANDGQVVYVGNSLREYGNLVIIKHTDDYLSAYGHNNEILVTQGQAVKRGQRIAGLGMTGASSPSLSFEIRRRGKPVDPLMYLPPR